MQPDINDDEAEGHVVGLVVGDLTLRANAALKYLDWYEGVMGPRWIGTERGAVKQDGRKAIECEIETKLAAHHYLRLHFLGEMD